MKIDKEAVYSLKLSGHQIKLIQTMITNAGVIELLNEQGEVMANVLYHSLEDENVVTKEK